MTLFYAQPYDISAEGFYFRSVEEYRSQSAKLKNSYGDRVEEFEIQFIDGDQIDCELAKIWNLNQVNINAFIEAADEWDETKKIHYIIAVGECGYSHEETVSNPDGIVFDIYELSSFKELAEQFIDDGLFGEIPPNLQSYICYNAIARDLAIDYCQIRIANTDLIYLSD